MPIREEMMSGFELLAMLNKRLKQSAIVFFAAALLFSATADEPAVKEPEAARQAETDSNTAAEDAEFNPTEEIIEDLSVPFPIDI